MTIAQSVPDTPFELSRAEIGQAFAPFVGKEFEDGDDATWNALMSKRRRGGADTRPCGGRHGET
jgi:hypothetical protein